MSAGPGILERHFGKWVAVAVLAMATLQLTSITGESATFDEAVHLAAGYRYWKTGKFDLNLEHPPLQKLLSAAPLLLLGPPLPTDEKLLIDQSEFAKAFLYQGPFPADRLLLLGRLPTVLLSLLLLIALAWAGRHYFGAPAALAAVWLCALDPNLIAHGRYVTTDMASTLFGFLAVVLWLRYLDAPSTGRLILTGLGTGLAFAAKFSVVYLLPLLPALALLHGLLLHRSPRRLFRAAAALTAVLLIAATVVAVCYAPESWRLLRGRSVSVTPETIQGILLPPHPYITGLRTVIDHNSAGHSSYLLGQVAETGWRYYFPVVFAVKSTVAALLLLLCALGLGLWRIGGVFSHPRTAFTWTALSLTPVLYFATAVYSNINLGVRHLLPIYPFLYLLAAGALAAVLPARRFLIAASLAVALQAAESFAVFPEYLAFFNAPSGGRLAGSRYLLDSNLDWGQDLKKLKTYVDTNPPGTLCLQYFGSAEPGYYGIRYEFLPRTQDTEERKNVNCIGAISATLLHGVYVGPATYEWLRARRPIGLVGSSIVLYDLRRPPNP